jgi:2-dehydropantoate 2-reductase
VLLSVKTQDVEEACKQIKSYASDIPIVTLQNGIRSDEIAANILGRENIIGGVVLFNAGFLNSGYVSYGVKGSLLIGEAYKKNGKHIEEIAAVLNRAIKTEINDNMYGAHWTKLLVNVMGNSLEAMTGISFGECLKNPGMGRIGIRILRETLEVVDKSDIKLESLSGLPISAFRFIGKSPLGVSSLLLRLAMSGTHTLTSTLQSIRKGRPTEIDYLNGEIARQGEKIGMATPYNSKVTELIHEVEKTGRFYSTAYLEKSVFK